VRAPLAVLEAIDREGSSSKAWDELGPRLVLNDEFGTVLQEYADRLGYLLQREGDWPPRIMSCW
jgi:hypothetical protein